LTAFEDFEPGTLPIDFMPALQYLPLSLQPWHKRLAPLVGRESELHLAFLNTLRKAVQDACAPDCFGKLLLEVGTSTSLLTVDISVTDQDIDAGKGEH
jgi:hypothetical protein